MRVRDDESEGVGDGEGYELSSVQVIGEKVRECAGMRQVLRKCEERGRRVKNLETKRFATVSVYGYM